MSSDTTLPQEPPAPVPTKKVTERTGLHGSTISRMVKDGRLTPVFRLAEGMGGAMFFAEADVQRLEAERQAAAS